MKLSIEAKVAAAVATGFLAVTVGVIAQTQDVAGPNNYGQTNGASIRMHISPQQHGNPTGESPES
jgi:hypothetical protein